MTKMQDYLLKYDRASVEQVAKAFGVKCKEVTEVYHQMVVDGIVAEYDAAHRDDDGLHLIDDEEFASFERFLKTYMKGHGFNKMELSGIIRECPSSISGWLYYKKHPRYGTVVRIADTLGLDVDEILNYERIRTKT